MSMVFTNVESTNLSQVGYDKNQKLLEVTFNNGMGYHYYNVEEYVYDNLVLAESHGLYFNKFVKGKYKYSLIGRR